MRLVFVVFALALALTACDSSEPLEAGLTDADLTALRSTFQCADIAEAPLGSSRDGVLRDGDCTTVGSTVYLADHYAFRLDAPATLSFTAEMRGGATPLVALRTGANSRLASSQQEGTVERNGDRATARITYDYAPGLYAVVVTTVGFDESGDYSLRISRD